MSAQSVNHGPAFSNGTDISKSTQSPLEVKVQDMATQTFERSTSPTSSEISAYSLDSESARPETPVNMFGVDRGDLARTFAKLRYQATPAEWDQIMEETRAGMYRGFESESFNFGVVKLAMKQLNPEMFEQSAYHLTREDFGRIKGTVEKFNEILRFVEANWENPSEEEI